MWNVHVSGPNLPSQRYHLAPGSRWVVGRAQDSDLVLPSDNVSRRHVQVSYGEDGLRVCDLGSRNGTLLNGRALGSVSRAIQPGDVVGVGTYVLKFDPVASAEPRRPDGFVTLAAGNYRDNPFTTRLGIRAPVEATTNTGYAPFLFQLAEQLASGIDTDTFLHEVLACARGVTGYGGGVLLGKGVEAFTPMGDATLAWSRTIAEAAIAQRSALLVTHVSTDSGFSSVRSLISSGHQHVLCAPLVTEREVFGVLYLFTSASEPPNQTTVHFIGSLARLATAALAGRAPRPQGLSAIETPIQRIHDDAEFLGSALSELSRVLAPDETTAPGVPSSTGEVRDLLEEAHAAVNRLSAELARVSSELRGREAA